MAERGSGQALRVERCCSLVASAFSDGRCETARLISGEHRAFSMNRSRTEVYVPYPAVESGWTPRSWTCGIALQCAPSKSLIEPFTLQALSDRQRLALSWVEGGVAMGWAVGRWPGLIPEFRRLVPLLEGQSLDLTGEEILDLALDLAARVEPGYSPVLGLLPVGLSTRSGLLSALRRAQGRMPWSKSRRYLSPGFETIPVGGESLSLIHI